VCEIADMHLDSSCRCGGGGKNLLKGLKFVEPVFLRLSLYKVKAMRRTRGTINEAPQPRLKGERK
jgi:hypothetical protein